jgi:polysaccharide export outer membrane protein
MKKTIKSTRLIRQWPALILPALVMTVVLLGLTGCQTGDYDSVGKTTHVTTAGKTNQLGQAGEPAHSEALILREGDVLKISFPGSPNLETTQQIRRDGKITLQLAGELTATGMSPADLEKEIAKAYGSQLISKEVTVTVLSSVIPIFVTGAVLHPQKVVADHPISALEAIMEAGGFDYAKANLKDVRVIRYEDGRQHTYFLNLKLVMEGKQSDPFYLKPFDIIYVPERFSMF